MKNRYFLLLVAMLFVVTGNLDAKMHQDQTPFCLQGIWQMCFYRSNSPDIPGELKTSNSFKILTDDGQFTNMVMMQDGAIIIGCGTYKQISENKYVETVKKNIHLPQLVNKNNEIQFETRGKDVMVLKFFLEEDQNGNKISSWCYETWKRVTMPKKYPEHIVR